MKKSITIILFILGMALGANSQSFTCVGSSTTPYLYSKSDTAFMFPVNDSVISYVRNTIVTQYDVLPYKVNILKAVEFNNKCYVLYKKSVANAPIQIAVYAKGSWISLGNPTNGTIQDIEPFNGKLYMKGFFDSIGVQNIKDFAKFDGVIWSAGLSIPGAIVFTSYNSMLRVCDNKLYLIGGIGYKDTATSVTFGGWITIDNNGMFSTLPVPTGLVYNGAEIYNNNLYVYKNDDNIGYKDSSVLYKLVGDSQLVVVSYFKMRSYNSVIGTSSWSDSKIGALRVYNGDLYVAGSFNRIGSNSLVSYSLVRYDGTNFIKTMNSGDSSASAGVFNLAVANSNLYLSGAFNYMGTSSSCSRLGYWFLSKTPVANFTLNKLNIYPGDTVDFTDLSTNTPTSWSWDFGGGTQVGGTSQNPRVMFTNVGSYTIRLTASNSNGSDMKTVASLVTVNPFLPVVKFGSNKTNVYAGQVVNFVDSSLNSPTSWSWSFPGGSPSVSTMKNPTVLYNTAGIYDVSLTVTNGTGSNTKIVTNMIVVLVAPVAPVADFSVSKTDVCIGDTVYFTDQSTNSPTSWSWDLGNGSSTSKNPYAVYTQAGSFTVSLDATNFAGSSTMSKTNIITVHSPIVASVTDSAVYYLLSVNFASSYRWYRNDILIDDTTKTIHPKDSGLYKVQLISQYGCVSTSPDRMFTTPDTTVVDTTHTGIREINDIDLLIYPNPTKGDVKVISKETISKVTATDLNGKIIMVVGESDFHVEMPGLYFLYIETLGGISTRKLLVE